MVLVWGMRRVMGYGVMDWGVGGQESLYGVGTGIVS